MWSCWPRRSRSWATRASTSTPRCSRWVRRGCARQPCSCARLGPPSWPAHPGPACPDAAPPHPPWGPMWVAPSGACCGPTRGTACLPHARRSRIATACSTTSATATAATSSRPTSSRAASTSRCAPGRWGMGSGTVHERLGREGRRLTCLPRRLRFFGGRTHQCCPLGGGAPSLSHSPSPLPAGRQRGHQF